MRCEQRGAYIDAHVSGNDPRRAQLPALVCGVESLELGWFDPAALPADTMAVSRIRIADAVMRQVAAFVR